MILVDANIWIDHLRHGDPHLNDLIRERRIRMHPYTIAEVGLGSLAHREIVIDQLERLPQAPVAAHQEVMTFIANQKIAGSGAGYVDCHLLTSAAINRAKLWTRDRRLEQIAVRLGLQYAAN